MSKQQIEEPDWALEDDIEIIAFEEDTGSYRVIEVGGQKRQAVISFTDKGRMLFDGEDIETEAFMGYVGLTDMVDEADKLVGKVIHIKDGELL